VLNELVIFNERALVQQNGQALASCEFALSMLYLNPLYTAPHFRLLPHLLQLLFELLYSRLGIEISRRAAHPSR
jgi:hypothetical protein